MIFNQANVGDFVEALVELADDRTTVLKAELKSKRVFDAGKKKVPIPVKKQHDFKIFDLKKT